MIFKRQKMRLHKSIRNLKPPKRLARRVRRKPKRTEKKKLGTRQFLRLKWKSR